MTLFKSTISLKRRIMILKLKLNKMMSKNKTLEFPSPLNAEKINC
jgi:hypothetical protein